MANSTFFNDNQLTYRQGKLSFSRRSRRKEPKNTAEPTSTNSDKKRRHLDRPHRRRYDDALNVRLSDAVRRVRSNFNQHEKLCNNHETNTIQYLIDPLLNALGWNFANPSEVVREYKPNHFTQQRADIALFEDAECLAVIEVKTLHHVCSYKHLNQLERYVSNMKRAIGILTNGKVWHIHYVFDGEIEIHYRMDVIEDSADDIATTLKYFISRVPTDRKKWPRKPSRRKLTTKRIYDALMKYRTDFLDEHPDLWIFSESTARMIAKEKPTNIVEMNAIRGVGDKTIENHGQAIRDIVKTGGLCSLREYSNIPP